MRGMATATLAGNLTRDPELRTTANGTSVTNVGVAVNERRKQGEEWVDVVHFFDVVIWGQQAEFAAKYFRKGQPVVVEGQLQQRSWETQDGGKRTVVEVKARYIQALSRNDDDGQARRSEPKREQKPKERDDFGGLDFGNEDDVPF